MNHASPVPGNSGDKSSILARMRAVTAAVLDADRRAIAGRVAEIAAFAGKRVAITGAVRRSAVFFWDAGVTLQDALGIAGGARPGAVHASVLRRSSDGTVTAIAVDLTDRRAVEMPLAAGDEVRVAG